MEYTLVVNVEKVRIKGRLEDTCKDDNSLRCLSGHHTPDPVEKVESPIGSETEKVVCRDRLCFTCLLDKEQLRKDGYCFE